MDKKKKVLIIDDEKDFLKITKMNLEDTGKYDVMTLLDSSEVLAALHSFEPDVILLDMRMPRLDGREIAEVLSNDKYGKDIPVVLVSSWPSDKGKLKPFKINLVEHFTKPVDIDSIIAALDKIERKEGPGKKLRILAVDDEEDFLHVLDLNLKRSGKYDLMTSPTAKDIISKVRSFRPDVIILDVMMPEVTGLEACRMLGEDPDARRIPVIILSALDREVEKIKAHNLGVVDYLVKSTDRSLIIAKIEAAISKIKK